MIKRRLAHWHGARWLQLAMGVAFLGQGIASGDALAYGAGAFFGLQALLNTGCCAAAGSCAVPRQPSAASPQAPEKDLMP